MYTYNIFAYLYFKSTKFYLSFYLPHPYARSLSYGFINFSYLVFYFFFFFHKVFTRRTRESTRFTRQFSSSVSFLFESSCRFFFLILLSITFLTYPYLCDSLWSIIVTTSRMISRRRSASLSLPSPRISWWRIIRTIMKISTPFPSPRIISKFHFPSPFLFRFCVSRILNRFQRHMYSELQISSARRGRAVFTPLLSSHRRRCCRSSSLLFLFFCFFFPPFCLNFEQS